MVGGGYLGSVGSAQAGGESGNNVGSPGRDGQDVTCVATPPAELACLRRGGRDGEDLAPGVVYR
jgi:hypothetical protein